MNNEYLKHMYMDLHKSDIFKIGVLADLDVKKLISLSETNKIYRIFLIQLFFLNYWYENYFLNFNLMYNKYTPDKIEYPSQI